MALKWDKNRLGILESGPNTCEDWTRFDIFRIAHSRAAPCNKLAAEMRTTLDRLDSSKCS